MLLVGVESNRSAIGAQVIVTYGGRRQAQAVLAQSSFLSVNDRRLHFGLGAEKSRQHSDPLAEWPEKSASRESMPDQVVITIREGSGIVSKQKFGTADTSRDLTRIAPFLKKFLKAVASVTRLI